MPETRKASMRVLFFEPRYVILKAAAKARRNKARQKKLCYACMKPLGEGRVKRHCHEKCYRATLRAIEKGHTTMSERIAAGKMAGDDERPTRPATNPVTLEFQGS